MSTTFDDFNLNKPLVNALLDLGYYRPTRIQEESYSQIMSGKNIMGIAQTGTGKTIAYVLPLLRLWQFSKDRFPQIMIIVPTRELVTQVVDEIESLTPYMNVVTVGVYGGVNIKRHIEAVEMGLDIIVGTPGRLLDLVYKGSLKMNKIKKLVIDEVDEMLNLGFRTQLKNILDLMPEKRQNLLFSATMTDEVQDFIDEYFDYFLKIESVPVGTPLENIEQNAISVPNYFTKMNFLKDILKDKSEYEKVLVFAPTKKLADRSYDLLIEDFPGEIGVIHSNKSQNNRFDTVDKFADGEYRIIIATDIVARGIDIEEVSHVINIDTPDVAENYIHRIGRTGRADKKGKSILLYSEKEEDLKTEIEKLMGTEISTTPLPDHIAISEETIPEEEEVIRMPNIELKMGNQRDYTERPAFHDKKDKNKKENTKERRRRSPKKSRKRRR